MNIKSKIQNPIQGQGQTKFVHATQSAIRNPQSEIVNPTLSLCMIVKDEERFLPGCLDSVSKYVDEIIIVDTGSTDKTVEIAQSYNARIYHHPWENSFSKARNYSLKYATCDWVLILDADEEIDSEDACKLREIIKEEGPAAFSLPVFNKPIGGKVVSVFNSPRIFKNHLDFYYEGIVHNRVKYSGATKNVNIRLYHYGYNLGEEQRKRKFIRSSNLLKEQVREDPHNPLPHHYLAVAYLNRDKYNDSIQEALEAIRLFELKNIKATLMLLTYYTASVAFYRKSDLCNAETYALKALRLYPDYPDAYRTLSSIYLRQREYSKCITVTEKHLGLLKSIESNPVTALDIPYNLQGRMEAYSRLAILNFEQGKEIEGNNALKLAINSADYEWEPYLAVGEYFLGQKDLDLAERFLDKGHDFNPGNKEFLSKLGRLYYLRNDYGRAETLYKQVLQIDRYHTAALKGLGILYLDTERLEEAGVSLYKALEKVKDVEIYNNLGCLEDKRDSYEKSLHFFRKSLELVPENQVIIDNIMNIRGKLSKESKIKKYAKPEEVSLSLCMIVKNEEKYLPGCLESVKDYVDEIIIVDTGSTDRTVEIAKKYNAKIYHHPWENSFSKARNYSLKYATCDWILWLDADEEVDKDDAYKLKDVIKCPVGVGSSGRANAVYLQMIDKPVGGECVSIMSSKKIFKNHLGSHFEGIVHNYLKCSGPTKRSDIRVYHYGYNLDDEQMERKFVRTSTLLKEQIKHDPKNPIPRNYLAISYLNKKKYDDCIQEALEAIRLFELDDGPFELNNSESHVKLLAYYVASSAFSHKNDLANAERYAIKALDFYPDYVDAYSILSGLYFQCKEYSKCLEATKKYVGLLESMESDPTMVLAIPYVTIKDAWIAYSRMAIVYFEQNKEYEAALALENAEKCNDNTSEIYLKIGKYFYEHDNFKLAERILMRGLEHNPDNKGILYCISDMYEKSGMTDKALTHIEKILEYCPYDILAQYRKGLLLSMKNKFGEAIGLFKSVIDKEPYHLGALFSLSTMYEKAGKVTIAMETYNKILTIEPENPEAMLKLGYLYLDNSDSLRAEELFINTLKSEKYLIDASLALSKIIVSRNDIEGCVMNCDRILKCLGLPGNVIIDSISDLSNLYIEIGKTLLRQHMELLADMSFEISVLLSPGAFDDENYREKMLIGLNR